MGLFEDVSETSNMAYSVNDSDGVCFVPAFNGLQVPINDHHAGALLIGMYVCCMISFKQSIFQALLQ